MTAEILDFLPPRKRGFVFLPGDTAMPWWERFRLGTGNEVPRKMQHCKEKRRVNWDKNHDAWKDEWKAWIDSCK